MNALPKILVVSSSHDPASRSELLARRCAAVLAERAKVEFVLLKDFQLRGEDLLNPLASESYRRLHSLVKDSVTCPPKTGVA